MLYTVYTDSISNIKKEELKGELIKNNEDYYFKMKETEFLFSPTYSLKVNHTQKAIVYAEQKNASENALNNEAPFIALINNYESKEVADKSESWECVLSNPKSLSSYSKIIFYISKRDYSIIKQIYFFSSSMEKQLNPNNLNTKKERFEIVQTSYTKSPKVEEKLFDLENYLNIKNNNYVPSEALKTYKVFVQ